MSEKPITPSAIDLVALAKSVGAVDVSVSPQETTEDAMHRRWKDKILFVFGIGCLALLFLTCLGILSFGNQSVDEKKMWLSVLISLVTGMVGFVIGKKS
jgi:hypothetical protein